MFGYLGFIGYTIVGLLVSGVCSLISVIDQGHSLALNLRLLSDALIRTGIPEALSRFVTEPFANALGGDELWIVLVGVLWPLAAVLLFFLVLVIMFGVFSGSLAMMRQEIF